MRFLILIALFTPLSCKPRTFNSHVENVTVKKNIATIDWACSGTGKQHPVGLNSQEEYCEWTRTPIAYAGVARNIADDRAEKINLPKACLFTTSFDQTRSFFLTKHTVSGNKSQGNPFWATQFNSYAFLVGGREPDSGIARDGIIGHCMKGNACFAPNCVPDRASDPQICRALNQLGKRGCKIDTNFEVAPIITASQMTVGRHGDRTVKPQLSVRPTIAPSCWYADDPKVSENLTNPKGQSFKPSDQRTLVACDASALNITNCDALAPDLSVLVNLKIENEECVSGKNSDTGTSGTSQANPPINQPKFGDVGVYCKIVDGDGPANVRGSDIREIIAKVDPGFEIFIRGFKMIEVDGAQKRYASVQFEKDGKKFGAGDGVPAFIHESQFQPLCRK